MDDFSFVWESFVAGIVASFACGLGVLPLAWRGWDPKRHIGLAYGFSGGLMIAASVYNLLLPALTLGGASALQLLPILKTLAGLFAGCLMMAWIHRRLDHAHRPSVWTNAIGGRVSMMVFVAMTIHSIPEGLAVGVGYAAETHDTLLQGLGFSIALAIAIHNIPEGLAVAVPLRADGASLTKCFWLAVVTSLPQPLAAVPASLMVWLFEPLMVPFLGFAAGAMMFLVIVELIPDALETRRPPQIAWAFMLGFGLMLLVQAAL